MRLELARKHDKPTIYDRLSQDLPINSKVAMDVVDDPYRAGDKIKVIRSVRDDPLAGMLSRGWLPRHEYEAGREWQRHYDHSVIGGVSAIDTTKEPVDGGRFPETLTDRKVKAMRKLAEAEKALGMRDGVYVRDILGEGLTLAQCAARHGLVGVRGVNYMGMRFRDGLNTLAVLWGYRTR